MGGLQEYTNYHFDCKPDGLRGALERFSQFFIAPLCKADALEREVNAVDNEFSGLGQSCSCSLCLPSKSSLLTFSLNWPSACAVVQSCFDCCLFCSCVLLTSSGGVHVG